MGGAARGDHPGLEELEVLVGSESALAVVHGAVRRAVQRLRGISEHGTCLVTCVDEYQSQLRQEFDRDVARPLLPGVPNRVFQISNIAGRLEPGALAIFDEHFSATSRKRGAKVLVIEIAAHVGRRSIGGVARYGELDRFGQPSACCGGLAELIADPDQPRAVRQPWLDRLETYFGPTRLAELRADQRPERMVSAAICHAVIQAEAALAAFFREPPRSPTHVLLVPMVVINQHGSDAALLVGCHHLRADADSIAIESGFSLRSTPTAHRFKSSVPLIVDSPWEESTRAAVPIEDAARIDLDALPVASRAALVQGSPAQREFQRARAQIERLAAGGPSRRIYARPILRGLLQGLTLVAPEVGLVALLAQGAGELAHAHHVRKVLDSGPSSQEARSVLQDIEPGIQQLSHEQAEEVLRSLLATYGNGKA